MTKQHSMYFLSFKIFLAALRVILCENSEEIKHATEYLRSSNINLADEENQKNLDVLLENYISGLTELSRNRNFLMQEEFIIDAIENFVKQEKNFLLYQYIVTVNHDADKGKKNTDTSTKKVLQFAEYIKKISTKFGDPLQTLSSPLVSRRMYAVYYLLTETVVKLSGVLQELVKMNAKTEEKITKNTIAKIYDNVLLLHGFFNILLTLQQRCNQEGQETQFNGAVINALLEFYPSSHSLNYPGLQSTENILKLFFFIDKLVSIVQGWVLLYDQSQNRESTYLSQHSVNVDVHTKTCPSKSNGSRHSANFSTSKDQTQYRHRRHDQAHPYPSITSHSAHQAPNTGQLDPQVPTAAISDLTANTEP